MIYVSTDSNEVRAILEDFDSSKDPHVANNKRLVRDYHQTFDKIHFDRSPIIMNLPINFSTEIQRKYNLKFNPISVIEDNPLTPSAKNILISMLTREDYFVAIKNGKRFECLPSDCFRDEKCGGKYYSALNTRAE